MRHFLVAKVAALLAALAFVGATAAAQGRGPGGGYGPGPAGGYGRGYGMMGGGYGPGPGYGPSGGAFEGRRSELTYAQAMRLLEPSSPPPRIDHARKRVVFSGSRVLISMAAVQPNHPDTTFEVAGLVDPTIVVPAGSTVTLSLVNMDYGSGMNHGVEITPVTPPYPVLGMMGLPDAVAILPILAPRSAHELRASRFAAAEATFQAPPPGVYYYICQYYDHAAKGMYGKLIVSGR